jgi:hypothetical protein
MPWEVVRRMRMRTKQMLAPAARLATRHCARVVMYHRFGSGDVRKVDVSHLGEQMRAPACG